MAVSVDQMEDDDEVVVMKNGGAQNLESAMCMDHSDVRLGYVDHASNLTARACNFSNFLSKTQK